MPSNFLTAVEIREESVDNLAERSQLSAVLGRGLARV